MRFFFMLPGSMLRAPGSRRLNLQEEKMMKDASDMPDTPDLLSGVSDRDAIRAVLIRRGIPFEERLLHHIGTDRIEGNVILLEPSGMSLQEGQTSGVVGYASFMTELRFDDEGRLVTMGLWE